MLFWFSFMFFLYWFIFFLYSFMFLFCARIHLRSFDNRKWITFQPEKVRECTISPSCALVFIYILFVFIYVFFCARIHLCSFDNRNQITFQLERVRECTIYFSCVLVFNYVFFDNRNKNINADKSFLFFWNTSHLCFFTIATIFFNKT